MKQRLLFLGPPGAGKGTQAEIICKESTITHLSTGELLRKEVKGNTDLGKAAAEIMNQGELVSDSIVLSIVEKEIISLTSGWLLDGFPRNLDQAMALEKLLNKLDQPIEAVVLIDIESEILVKRLLARGREDDNEEVIRNRLKVFESKTAPLKNHYRKSGLLKTVNGVGEIQEIKNRIKVALK